MVQVYERNLEFYVNWVEQRLPQYALTKFISMLPKKARVLDAGCAAGRDSRYIAEHGFSVTGIDISSNMIWEARRRASLAKLYIDFKAMDLEALNFNEESFDAVWCYGTLNHIRKADLKLAMKGFSRVLKKGGIIFIEAEEGEGEKEVERNEILGERIICAFFSQLELEEALTTNGFEILSCIVDDNEINLFAKKL